MIVKNLLTILGSMWLFIEIGQAIQKAIPDQIGQNPMYWYLWGCVSLIIVLIAHALDNYFATDE